MPTARASSAYQVASAAGAAPAVEGSAFAAAFFPAMVLVGTFLAGPFLEAAFLLATFLAFAGAFLLATAGASAAVFAGVDVDLFDALAFLTVAVLATFFVAATFADATVAAGPEAAPSIKNESRDFAEAIHAGARPKPVQVAPDFGSRYFGVPASARLPLTFFAADFLVGTFFTSERTLEVRCSTVSPKVVMISRILAMAPDISSLVFRATSASSLAI